MYKSTYIIMPARYLFNSWTAKPFVAKVSRKSFIVKTTFQTKFFVRKNSLLRLGWSRLLFYHSRKFLEAGTLRRIVELIWKWDSFRNQWSTKTSIETSKMLLYIMLSCSAAVLSGLALTLSPVVLWVPGTVTLLGHCSLADNSSGHGLHLANSANCHLPVEWPELGWQHPGHPWLIMCSSTMTNGHHSISDNTGPVTPNSHFFEGVEKNLEVWFTNSNGITDECDLRNIPR